MRTTYNTVVTIKRDLNELGLSFFRDIAKKSPVGAVELEPGKWAFSDNKIGQGRNYFCDMFGYSLAQDEYDFEYFEEPQVFCEMKEENEKNTISIPKMAGLVRIMIASCQQRK